MISLRREIHESELLAARFAELLKAFKVVATAVSTTAIPANPEVARRCRQALELATALLDSRRPQAIEEAGKLAVHEIELICCANRAALEDRDTAVRAIVTLVASAVGTLKGDGENHNSNLTKLLGDFDVLSQIEDPNELRRELHKTVEDLRGSIEEMRRDSEISLRRFESQMSVYQQRLEMARKGSGTDRLTGLGSKLEASRHLLTVSSRDQPICFQLFDIEAFGEINQQHGTLFGDQLLKALTHMLRTKFAGQEGVFRWGADEFLVIGEGELPWRVAQCGAIRRSFADGQYLTVKDGVKVALNADVAYGVAQYHPGEGIEEAYRRARQALEQNRKRSSQ